jgi:hypothetical protein
MYSNRGDDAVRGPLRFCPGDEYPHPPISAEAFVEARDSTFVVVENVLDSLTR